MVDEARDPGVIYSLIEGRPGPCEGVRPRTKAIVGP